MTSGSLRVAVLSASTTWREGVQSLLEDAGGIVCIGAAATTAELGRLTPTPDAVVVDALDGEMLEAFVQHEAPAMPFVILSDEPERESAARALASGGVAILERNVGALQLAGAVRAAVSGLTVLSPIHAANLMDSTGAVDAPRSAEWIQPLTPRELQILRMLSDGLPNKSIATALEISEHTAKFHVGQILAKLGAESRTEAVTIGIRHGLVMV
jgi:DNA-binding NarL/FixJ family response regulator